MKFKFINLIGFLLLLSYQSVAADITETGLDEKYLNNSVLFQLRDKKGSFITDIEGVFLDEKVVDHFEEKYDFESENGVYVGQYINDSSNLTTSEVIYLNEDAKAIQINKKGRNCKYVELKSVSNELRKKWAPGNVYDEKKDYKILGPNVLLSVLMDHLKPEKTEPKLQNYIGDENLVEGMAKKPDEKTTEKPDEKTTEKPDEKTTEKPDEKTTEKPDEKTTEKPDEKTTEKPDEKTTEKPDEKTTEKPDEKTTEKPDEKTTEKPDEKTTEKPDEKTTEKPDEKRDLLCRMIKNHAQCIITFKDQTKLEFNFEDKNELTMFPVSILVKKKQTDGNWKTIRQFNYFKFQSHFSEKSIVNTNLPIGYGCESVKKFNKNKFGDHFQLDFEVVFKYLMTDENKPPVPDDPKFMAFAKVVKNKDRECEKYYLTRSYFNKMYHNDIKEINVAYTINEALNNVSIKSMYNLNTHIISEIQLDDHKCYNYRLKPIHSINYFYVQDLFINHPEFFKIDEKNEYNYIGEYNVHNIPCLVYEKSISDFDTKEEPDQSDEDEKNKLMVDNIHRNINKVKSNHAIVTHYYPKDKKYWGEYLEQYEVPMKIEIRLFTSKEHDEQIAKLTINVASFKTQVKEFEILDMSACIEHTYDYNWFLIKFGDDPELVKEYSKYEDQIKNRFKQILPINPLRIGEIFVDSDDYSIYVTGRLLELTNVNDLFHEKKGQTIEKTQMSDEYADSEDVCARRCLSNKNCAAYFYCALDCKLYIDKDFDNEFDPNKGKDYDWSKISTIEDKECSYHRRIVKFNEESHSSNLNFLRYLNNLIEEDIYNNTSNLDLILTNEKSKSQNFKAINLEIDVQPGKHSKSHSILNDEDLDDERNHYKYNELFSITNPEKVFDRNKIDKTKLIVHSDGLLLWECQLLCMNNGKCSAFSYCSDSKECILTTLVDKKEVNLKTVENPKCNTATKKYLAMYNKHANKGIVKDAKKIIEKESTFEFSENDCALECSKREDCSSFDYCVGTEEKDDKKKVACYLHDKHPLKDKKEGKKPNWSLKTNCDHYTYKHSREFNEYSAVKLKANDKDLIVEEKTSLEGCASACVKSETCNSFDYCTNQDNGHLTGTTCRMSVKSSNLDNVEKDFTCSVYSKINPSIKTADKIIYYNNPVSAGLTAFLSILFLVIGAAVGTGISYYVIKNYFVSY